MIIHRLTSAFIFYNYFYFFSPNNWSPLLNLKRLHGAHLWHTHPSDLIKTVARPSRINSIPLFHISFTSKSVPVTYYNIVIFRRKNVLLFFLKNLFTRIRIYCIYYTYSYDTCTLYCFAFDVPVRLRCAAGILYMQFICTRKMKLFLLFFFSFFSRFPFFGFPFTFAFKRLWRTHASVCIAVT